MVTNSKDIVEEEKPCYYSIIPAPVRYDECLTANAKLLYGEISALTKKEGKCWARNSYFADLFKVSNSTISVWIKSLVDRGHIKSTIIYKEGTKEILNRYLEISNEGYLENSKYPTHKNLKDNNTSINNTSINNTRHKYKYFESSVLDDAFNDFVEMRKKKKKPLTDRALKMAINDLMENSSANGIVDEELMLKVIEQTILHGWDTFYPLKKEKKSDIDWEFLNECGAI